MDAIGILPRFGGTSVHDGWRSYFLYACTHALCLVHLLRELTFLAEEQGLEWAADLKALLLEMKEATDEAREHGRATLHPLEVEDWQAQFVALVAHANATTPTAQAPPGTKGRVKQSAARNLLDRLIDDQEAVLAFLHRLVVPFDNNQAERDVRMVPRSAKGLWLLPQRSRSDDRLTASAATCRRCASRAWICSPPWRPHCAVIPSFLHSSLLRSEGAFVGRAHVHFQPFRRNYAAS